MRVKQITLLFGAALLLMAVSALAQETQTGSVRFRIPKGWKRVDQAQTVVLLPPEATGEKNLGIAILPGKEIEGDLRGAFEALITGGVGKGEKLVQSSETRQERSDKGFDYLLKIVTVEDTESGRRTVRLYAAAKVGSRMETVIVAFNDRELYERYQADVEAFFNSWSFVRSEKSEPEVAPRSRTEPVPVRRPRKPGRNAAPFQIGELYVANILVNRPKTYGIGYEYVSWNEFWLILPGGRVYFGMPPGDPGDLDWDAVRREYPEKIAACSVTGGQYRFTWRKKPITLPRGINRMDLGRTFANQVGTTVFKRVVPVQNLRLTGIYARRSFADTSSALQSGGVSGETKFGFNEKGQFVVTNFVAYSAASKLDPVPGVSSALPTGPISVLTRENNARYGTYRIGGNTLELTYSDGTRERLFFFRYPDEEETVICIDGANYLRQKP
jgi:hypothetical protein